MSIHILGTGAIGCHMAAILRRNQKPVTLLLRSQAHLEDFQKRNNRITYRVQGQTHQISGFEAETIESPGQAISSLIVSTKALHTTQALKTIAPRLTRDTTILLLQNGMGVSDEIAALWPEPQLYVGVNRHAVERQGPFDVCHHSGYHDPDALRVGLMPGQVERKSFIQSLVKIPELNALQLDWPALRLKIYRKLIVNACINPVASALETPNRGNIHKGNPGGMAMMRSICEEAYEVLKDGLPGETVDSLFEMVLDINRDAGNNISSTLQDIRAKRLTEIDYINGYICKKGLEKNINVKSNQFIVDLIHAKEALYDF